MKKDFLNPEQESIFSPEERKEIIQAMRDVANCRLSVSNAQLYCEMLAKAIKTRGKPFNCPKCEDTGLLKVKELKGQVTTFKCKCK